MKMVAHFEKLQTPLRSIYKYPSLHDQQCRFMGHGWSSVDVKNLWDVWCEASIVSLTQRKALDEIEPFDEWEEFILFASHYFLLVAVKSSLPLSYIGQRLSNSNPEHIHTR